MTETHPQNRLIGYARVSTYGQTLDAQLEQLRGADCTKIYREKVTGARSDRRELLRMLAALAPSDVVTVTRIDRLARSTFDLFAIVKQIVDAKAQFRSLAEPWGDTGTSTGRLMIAVLGGLADVERDLIRTRTVEGRSRAKAKGQHMGRPPALMTSADDIGTAEGGHPAPSARRYARRTRAQLQRRHLHHSPYHARRLIRTGIQHRLKPTPQLNKFFPDSQEHEAFH
jgi:DNA invertase Pin-like site-specific DNA recombinase